MRLMLRLLTAQPQADRLPPQWMIAIRQVHSLLQQGHTQVVDADLAAYFDSIPHAESMKSVARRVLDRQVLHLIKMWLDVPVEETDERGRKKRTTAHRDEKRGIPQGSPLSPLLANLYMRRFVLGWQRKGFEARWCARPCGSRRRVRSERLWIAHCGTSCRVASSGIFSR